MKKSNNPKRTRADKVEEAFRAAPPLEPLNIDQSYYIQDINSHPITFATGRPGTSKTYIPSRIACQWLKTRAIKQIVCLRPAVSASESIGFAKGTHEEKMRHWVRPIMKALKQEFAPGQLKQLLSEEVNQIDFCPLENVKGESWDDAFIIVDEAEDCTLQEIKHLITRVGKNSTMVICGDIDQSDLQVSGMGEFLKLREKSDRLKRVTAHNAFYDPEYKDIVRSDICREVVQGLDEAQAA